MRNHTLLPWISILLLCLSLGVSGCGDDTPAGNKSGENQGGENQGGENQGGENQGGENQGGENQGGENQGGENQGGETTPEDCNPITDPDCDCRPGQFRLCSSLGDPTTFPPNSACVAGFQRCIRGEWEEECHGEITPESGVCDAQDAVENCAGFLNEAGECIEGPVGEPADPSIYCGEGDGGPLGDPCSCEVPEGGEEFLRVDQPCYSGPAGTLGVGTCRAGVRSCQPDQTWGACIGEVTPVAEICGDGLDNDCDGVVDNGCEYCPPHIEDCEAYQSGYLDEPCPDGSPKNSCGGCGEVSAEEICGDGIDNNCNGFVDEGCACDASSQPCYPGPPETAGVGECSYGVQSCSGEFWGACVGYVLPTPERCGPDGTGTGTDDNCNGIIDDGCACVDGDTRPCGSDVGACQMGVQTCTDGEWSSCEGAIGPSPEQCDGIDNNCNGIVDDDLRDACGNCGGPCYTHQAPTDSEDLFEEGLEFVDADDDDNPTGKDGVTLNQQSIFPKYLWAANSADGQTVSKVDTETGLEVGRYWVGLNPSRTAVDLEGNMWVTGRDDGRVTRVLWNPDDCPAGATSERLPNGTVTVVNSASDPLADACVVYSDRPGLADGFTTGRGVAVDANGQIWIGYSDSGGAIQRINPNDYSDVSPTYPPHNIPEYTANINGDVAAVPGSTGSAGRIYGLVADSQGYVYGADLWDSDGLPRFNTATGEWDMFVRGFDCAIYGIAIDGQDRVWMGCGDPGWAETHNPTGDGIAMFDPNTMKIHRFHVPSQFQGQLPAPGTTAQVQTHCNSGCAYWETTALAVEPATGDVWATVRLNGYVLRLKLDENDLSQSTWHFVPVMRDGAGNWRPGANGGGDMRGVGFDRDGHLWYLGMATTHIWKVNADTEQFIGSYDIGTHGHYTYSDFTGASAFNFTAPRGIYRYIFESPFPTTLVDEIFIEATVPASTSLSVRIRPLDDNGQPITGDWYPPTAGPGTTAYYDYPVDEAEHIFDINDLEGFPIEGTHFEVEIRMTRSDSDIRPFLHDLQLNWHRP